MLGQFARQPKELPEISVASTKVTDAIKEHWNEERSAFDVTLDKNDPIWKEWWIGASVIHKVCPRMFALMSARGIEGIPKEVLKAETLWLFDQGHAYHDMFQQKILPSFPPGVLLGRWKRQIRKELAPSELIEEYTNFKNDVPEGMSLERGWGPRPEGDGWMYDEPKIRIPEYRIVVKLDAIFDWPDEDGLEVVEIKTEKPEAKDDLNPKLGGRPRLQHIEQAHVGMWATGIERGRIIYVFKGEKSLTTSIIEHLVPRDEKLIDEIKARAKACVDAVREIDRVRDVAIEPVCISANGPDEDTDLPFGDLMPDLQDEIRISMKVAANEMPKLPECQMKSKGKPKYCAGRDLCFGVRKKKKKVV